MAARRSSTPSARSTTSTLDGRRGDRCATSCARPRPSRCAGSPRTPASRATSRSSKVGELEVGNGLNAATGEYGDLIKAGVIDPVKVTRSALRNAASIASMVLTTDTLVVEKKVARSRQLRRGHGHGHGH